METSLLDITIKHLKINGRKVDNRSKLNLQTDIEEAKPHFDDEGLVDILSRRLPFSGVGSYLDDVISITGLSPESKGRILERLCAGKVPCQKSTLQ